MTLPSGIVREVFGKEYPDKLLHLLSSSKDPILYTQARDALNLQPEQFRRALGSLEKWGLVQLRVVPRAQRPDNRRRVQIQLTALGQAAVRLHTTIDQEWRKIIKQEGLQGEGLVVS